MPLETPSENGLLGGVGRAASGLQVPSLARMSFRPSLSGLFGSSQDEMQDSRVPRKTLLIDAASMKERLRLNMIRPVYNVVKFYHTDGIFQWLAQHRYFEAATLCVIAFNALWISIDTDHNSSEMLIGAQPVFQIAEHSFCAYFSFEWFVRFCAFKKKRNGLRDGWFVFDSLLVLMMVLETWVMNVFLLASGAGSGGGLGNASILRLARLLRLSRMARMARLLRAMPELMILIKGMVSAMRSVFFTMMLLAMLTYIFGIMFTQMMVDTSVGQTFFFDRAHCNAHTSCRWDSA